MKNYPVITCTIIAVFSLLILSCNKNNTPDPVPDPVLQDTLTTGWSKMTFPSQESLFDIFFSGNSAGFTVSATGIYKSADGGASWQKVYSSPQGFVNIGMSSTSNAFFAKPGKIVMTRNGGTAFDSILLNDPALSDVFCISNQVTYAAGQSFWKTTDGGTTWIKLSDFNQPCSAIYFMSELVGWAAGDFGLRKTINGGLNWQTVTIGASLTNPLSVFFSGSNSGFIATQSTVGRTTDGGANWLPVYTSQSFYHDIHFLDANTGYITDGRFILKSTNGGATWAKVVRLGQGDFIEVHFTDPGHGWAASSNGIVVRFQ